MAAEALGFKWRVWTDAEFSPVLIRNLRHLDPFLKLPLNYFPTQSVDRLKAIVAGVPGVSVDLLAERVGPEGQAFVRWAIAHQIVYADLNSESLADGKTIFVHASQEVAAAAAVLKAPKV